MVDLSELFKIQQELNVRCGFDAEELFWRADGKIDLQFAGIWVNNFIMGAYSELEELRDCTHWKHWYKEAREGKRFQIHDLEGARKEVVDLLFFWMSLAQAVGMTAEDVERDYLEKAKLNHQRQDDDCTTKEAKTYVRDEYAS